MNNARLALLALVFGGVLAAQEGNSWINVQGGAHVPVSSKHHPDFSNVPTYGLGGGSWLSDRWGLELSGLTARPKFEPTLQKGDEHQLYLSGLLNLNPGGAAFYPYLRGGVGLTSMGRELTRDGKAEDRPNFHAGLGLQQFFAEHAMAFAEARFVRIGVKDNIHNDLLALVGVGYRWGKAAAPAPAPKAPEPAPLPPPPAPEPPKPVEEPKPVEAPKPVEVKPVEVAKPAPPKKIVLDEAVLHFANGKSKLSEEGMEAIRKVAESLKQYQGSYTLEVSGHTSSVGSAAFNKKLSKQRADAVAKVLIDAGIPAASVKTVGVGPDKPIADNKTKEGQAKNRRVEIDVQTQDSKVEVRKLEVGEGQ